MTVKQDIRRREVSLNRKLKLVDAARKGIWVFWALIPLAMFSVMGNCTHQAILVGEQVDDNIKAARSGTDVEQMVPLLQAAITGAQTWDLTTGYSGHIDSADTSYAVLNDKLESFLVKAKALSQVDHNSAEYSLGLSQLRESLVKFPANKFSDGYAMDNPWWYATWSLLGFGILSFFGCLWIRILLNEVESDLFDQGSRLRYLRAA